MDYSRFKNDCECLNTIIYGIARCISSIEFCSIYICFGLRFLIYIYEVYFMNIFFQVGLQLYMGVLRQKCIPTYESFLNNSGVGYNVSYTFYLKQMENESML